MDAYVEENGLVRFLTASQQNHIFSHYLSLYINYEISKQDKHAILVDKYIQHPSPLTSPVSFKYKIISLHHLA